MKKILVATPTYEGLEYCFDAFLEAIKSIDYSTFDILVVDNSRTKRYLKKLKTIKGIKVIYDDTNEEKNMFRVASSRNKILDYAIQNDYDYLLMMDSDVIVPSLILKKLLSNNKDVCSGLYYGYSKKGGEVKLEPICFIKLSREEFEKYYQPHYPHANWQELSRQLTKQEAETGQLYEVAIPSAGCVLLSKKVLSSGVRYGFFERYLRAGLACTEEVKFFAELRKKGFKIYCDTSIICGHEIKEKYKGGGN